MASLRAFRHVGALLAGRAPAGALLPATAAARLSAGAPRPALTAALHSFPVSRDREEGPNPAAPHTRSLMPFSVSALRGMATSEVNIIGETSSGLPPTVHALKYPTSEIQYDEKMHPRFAPGGDESKRAFTYMVLTGGRFIYASAIRLVILKFLLSMSASKDVLALASLEVDLGAIEEGQTITVKWRGKPVFIRRRTEAEIADATAVEASSLRDPQTDEERAVKPEWLVLVGVCTHLGCVPLSNAGDYNGWFCPCHGSHYDVSGRIRKGPAPYNLEVPQYKFLSDDKLLVG